MMELALGVHSSKLKGAGCISTPSRFLGRSLAIVWESSSTGAYQSLKDSIRTLFAWTMDIRWSRWWPGHDDWCLQDPWNAMDVPYSDHWRYTWSLCLAAISQPKVWGRGKWGEMPGLRKQKCWGFGIKAMVTKSDVNQSEAKTNWDWLPRDLARVVVTWQGPDKSLWMGGKLWKVTTWKVDDWYTNHEKYRYYPLIFSSLCLHAFQLQLQLQFRRTPKYKTRARSERILGQFCQECKWHSGTAARSAWTGHWTVDTGHWTVGFLQTPELNWLGRVLSNAYDRIIHHSKAKPASVHNWLPPAFGLTPIYLSIRSYY